MTKTEALKALGRELDSTQHTNGIAVAMILGTKVSKQSKYILADHYRELRRLAYAVVDTQYEDTEEEV